MIATNIDPRDYDDDVADRIAQEQVETEQAAKRSRKESEKKGESTSAQPKPRDRYKPFPSHLLPSPMRELVVEGAQAIGCDESYIALPLLSATGAAIGNTVRLVVKKGWNVPPAIWTLICGESGTAKSPAFKVAKAPIQRYQKQKLEEYRQERGIYDEAIEQYNIRVKEARKAKSAELPEKPDRPTLSRIVVSDCTVEALAPIFNENPRGLLLQRDELNGWLGSFNAYKATKGADESAWLSMFDGESLTVDRKGEGTEPTFVESAIVSITGGIQPKVFADSMSQEHRASGMAARFLVAQPPRVPQTWTDDEISEGTLLLIDRLFIKLLEIDFGDPEAFRPHFIGLSADAKSVFRSFFNLHHREQADLVGDDAAAWSKLLGYVPRIALIFHIVKQVQSDGDIANAVSADTMNESIDLVAWFKNEAARLYAAIDDNDGQREVREVAEWIIRRGGEATPSDLVRGIRSIATVQEAEAMGVQLIRAGLAVWATIDTPSGTGPQKRVLRTT